MSGLTVGAVATVIFALLSIGGGVMGYTKSQSKISLISGVVSGFLLLLMAAVMVTGAIWAEMVAVAIISLLVVVFVIRWFKTKNLIPALPMVFFGIVSIVLILG